MNFSFGGSHLSDFDFQFKHEAEESKPLSRVIYACREQKEKASYVCATLTD